MTTAKMALTTGSYVAVFALLGLLVSNVMRNTHHLVAFNQISTNNRWESSSSSSLSWAFPEAFSGLLFSVHNYKNGPSIPMRRQIPLSELTQIDPEKKLPLVEECTNRSMTWLENKEIVSDTSDSSNTSHTSNTSMPTVFNYNYNYNYSDFANQKIPLIIHQSSSSRCIPTGMVHVISHWRNLPMYQYYLHDDDAVWKLFDQDWPEFPLLHKAVSCVKSMTALVDVWRLLVLWEYGGIYVDLDSAPNTDSNHTWTPHSIHADDDAYMVVEFYDTPSQYFMAVTPRHPVMYYAVHVALSNIIASDSNLRMDPSMTTGPFALLDAFSMFLYDSGKQMVEKPVEGGGRVYVGMHNRSVRLDGYGRGRSDEIVQREAIRRHAKQQMYSAMNMKHFLQEVAEAKKETTKSGRSCMAVLFDFDIGPPSWYVRNETAEDRMTLGGMS